jgi:MSHA biogenesis protein MshK
VSEMRVLIAVLVLAASFAARAEELPLKDPMRPNVVAGPASGAPRAEPGFELTAVLVSDSRRIAVVNGRICHVGDRVNGAEIVAIEQGSIRIRRAAGDVLIKLRKDDPVTARNDGEQDQ